MKITYLRVYSENIERQLQFYRDNLKLPISKKTDHGFHVKIGYSELEFQSGAEINPYHIAFHIGAHQEAKALNWLKSRAEILEDQGNAIVDFPAWNAKSIYFYDQDRNIIEFISRKHLHETDEPFSEKSLCGIAEIGLATKDVGENYRFLNQYFKLGIYFGTPEVFCAIGDENGLLITVDQNKKTWFPTNEKALPANFDLKFEHNGKMRELNYTNAKLDIL
ncbi:MAG TPA: VOC family protein [Flavobacteriaceae bacterium]|nr:VOC family protein [Flavobacteriaceae bacterium]